MDILVQQLINGLVLGSMYALVALGYTMVYGVLNLINFAHGDVLMIGAMTGWTLLSVYKNSHPSYRVSYSWLLRYWVPYQCVSSSVSSSSALPTGACVTRRDWRR